MMIEAMTTLRIIRAVNAIAVELTRSCIRQVGMPDLVGVLGELYAVELALTGLVEQADLDLFRILREQGEIDALAIPSCAQRIRLTWPHADRLVSGNHRPQVLFIIV